MRFLLVWVVISLVVHIATVLIRLVGTGISNGTGTHVFAVHQNSSATVPRSGSWRILPSTLSLILQNIPISHSANSISRASILSIYVINVVLVRPTVVVASANQGKAEKERDRKRHFYERGQSSDTHPPLLQGVIGKISHPPKRIPPY